MHDAESILNAVSLPQHTATICVDGALNAQYQELLARFENASDKQTKMNEPAEKDTLAQELKALYERMQEFNVTFYFEAMPAEEWLTMQAEPKYKARNQQERWNLQTFLPALITRCLVKPVFTEEQISQLMKKLSYAQLNELFDAAYSINEKKANLPFFGSVSRYLERSETKQS